MQTSLPSFHRPVNDKEHATRSCVNLHVRKHGMVNVYAFRRPSTCTLHMLQGKNIMSVQCRITIRLRFVPYIDSILVAHPLPSLQ